MNLIRIVSKSIGTFNVRPPVNRIASMLTTLRFASIVLGIAALMLGSQSVLRAQEAAKIVDFDRDVAPILVAKCLSCHEGEEAKNGFLIGDREQVLGFVSPGDAANSSLWTDYLLQPSKQISESSLVMPPDGPLPTAELAILKTWIDEGAVWPEGAKVSKVAALETKEQTAPETGAKASASSRLYLALGYFHPAVVHFPIALFAVAGFCAFFSYFIGKRCESMAFHLLWIGVLSSFPTVFMGWGFADLQGYPAWNKALPENATHDQTTFFGHRWLGTSVLPVSVIVFMLSIIALRRESKGLRHAWLLGTMMLALLVGIVGHQGGELKYGDIFEKAWKKWES
ncbi:MAG: hypothetical protein MUC83_00950 [Pirellula sp.]|jgi:uncharacterized membrane protein|nr:hypothetical protein [Pirellula sp.]